MSVLLAGRLSTHPEERRIPHSGEAVTATVRVPRCEESGEFFARITAVGAPREELAKLARGDAIALAGRATIAKDGTVRVAVDRILTLLGEASR